MPSSKAIHLLLLHTVLQQLGISVQPGGVSAEQHRKTRHTSPSPEPTLEPATSFSAAVHVHVDSVSVSLDVVGSGKEFDKNAFDYNDDAWKAVPSPIADSARPPATTTTSDITTDAAIGTLIIDQKEEVGVVNDDNTESSSQTDGIGAASVAPIYALRHGRGVFAVIGGTGCYKGARGQAQAEFGIKTSRVDLFVPSISWIFDDDDDDDDDDGPQDTVWKRAGDDGRQLHGSWVRKAAHNDEPIPVADENATTNTRTTATSSNPLPGNDHDHRKLNNHRCDMFRKRGESFNIISLDLERRSNPMENKNVMNSSVSYHEHGKFLAKERWFAGVQGEYSLSCLHHECKLSFHFGIGPLNKDSSSTMKRRNLMNAVAENYETTSLFLQGTTELAYQGQATDMLVCIENCDVMAVDLKGSGPSGSSVELDAEHIEAINLRAFDNSVSLLQVGGSTAKGTKAPKATKTPKASKGTTNSDSECLISVPTSTTITSSKGSKSVGKGKGGKGTIIGLTSKGSKGTLYANAPFGTPCTGGACADGVCLQDLCAGVTCATPAGGDACETIPGVCDRATGQCVYTVVADGTACDDGDDATNTDTCQGGVCVGVNPCDAVNCGANEVCANGVCIASDPLVDACTGVICSPDTNFCQSGGVCSLVNGEPLCFYDVAADGTTCNDGDPDTINDVCTDGVCFGTNPCDTFTCPTPDPNLCQVTPSVCDPNGGTPTCIYTIAADGTECDDFNTATCIDQCVSGVCTGTTDLNACCAEADGSLFTSRTVAGSGDCGVPCGTDGGCCAATYNVIDGATGPNGGAEFGDNCCPSDVLMCPSGGTGSLVTCCYGTLLSDGIPCNADGSCPPPENAVADPDPADLNVFCANQPGSDFSARTDTSNGGCGVTCGSSGGCCGTKHDATDPTVPGNGQNRFSDNCCPADRLMCGDNGDTECCYATAFVGGTCAGSGGQFCP